MHQLLYFEGKNSLLLVKKEVGGSHCTSDCPGEDVNPFPMPEFDPQIVQPIAQLSH